MISIPNCLWTLDTGHWTHFPTNLGFSMSTGLGENIAQWIVGCAPEIDLALFDPARFLDPEISENELLSRSIREYANYYTPLG